MKSYSINLSKSISCHLRHRKSLVDDKGWAKIRDLYLVIRDCDSAITYGDFMAELKSDNRFEISEDGKFVRAKTGHTNGVIIEGSYKEPPDVLYYVGNISDLYALNVGLSGNIHLVEMNKSIKRRIGKSIILKINARSMRSCGYKFYKTKYGEWYVSDIPVRFVYLIR